MERQKLERDILSSHFYSMHFCEADGNGKADEARKITEDIINAQAE
jgi:hypothetical protein